MTAHARPAVDRIRTRESQTDQNKMEELSRSHLPILPARLFGTRKTTTTTTTKAGRLFGPERSCPEAIIRSYKAIERNRVLSGKGQRSKLKDSSRCGDENPECNSRTDGVHDERYIMAMDGRLAVDRREIETHRNVAQSAG